MKKKKNNLIFPLLVMGIFLVFASSCKKYDDNNGIPVLESTSVTEITHKSAKSGGDITSDGGASVISRGVCWSSSHTPTIADNKTSDGTGKGSFSTNLNGLTSGVTYYLRAYATNSVGTAYGDVLIFTTPKYFINGNGVVDLDGNSYNTIIVGEQEWMVENLKVTKYRNGNPISSVTDNVEWSNLTVGAYCNYENNLNNATIYGRLYNWYAVTDNRNICPTGWHVPSIAEWQTLVNYLGDDSIAGGMLKEIGNTHWHSPNSGATNESGFSGLPGGNRIGAQGAFDAVGSIGFWWLSDEANASNAMAKSLNSWTTIVGHGQYPKNGGFSVRCIKD
ncbi:MAG: fibrobacter succinogenes major paralogous domain-containing protein [Bacteroidales bacterium]|nr:fibrobacter succinogenes major paralogous domain-containing protein [Bacteroidales bacterium]